MTSYRLYFIGGDEHIASVEVVDCSTDDDALGAARRSCCDYRAVEVWNVARRVDRIANAVKDADEAMS